MPFWGGLRVSILDNVKARPSFIDLEKAGSRLPSPQNDHPRVVPEVVNGAVDMADDHQVSCSVKFRRVGAEDLQMPFLIVRELAVIIPREDTVEDPGRDSWDVAERREEPVAFQKCFPGTPGPKPMPMHDSQAQAGNRDIEGVGNDLRAQLACVKRAEPGIVIAGHDRQGASVAVELGQSRQALAAQELTGAVPGGHPEIAEITRDQESIDASQAANPCAEPPVAIRSIGPQVDVAGEIVRHDR
jgi:hypothetical protein